MKNELEDIISGIVSEADEDEKSQEEIIKSLRETLEASGVQGEEDMLNQLVSSPIHIQVKAAEHLLEGVTPDEVHSWSTQERAMLISICTALTKVNPLVLMSPDAVMSAVQGAFAYGKRGEFPTIT